MQDTGIKKNNLSIVVLFIFLVFVTSTVLSGCGHEAKVLTGGLSLKLINQKTKVSPFFGVLYSRAVSIDRDSFYPALFKNGYIKFNRKLGYSSFTAKLRPFLFKKAGKIYVVFGGFSAQKPNVKFISQNRAEVSFDFVFKPNRLYKLAKDKNIAFPRLNKIIRSGKAVAVFMLKPSLGWQIAGFKPFSAGL